MTEIDPKLVGKKLSTIKRDITWRDTTNYAAAVNDLNPRYFDDIREDGIVAPPMLAVTLTWPMVGKMREQLGESITPEAAATMVHATGHLVFHRLIRPGDKLKIEGKVAAVLPTRAGTRFVLRFDATDDRDKPVFTEYNGGIFRGIECKGEGKGEKNLPEAPEFDKPESTIWKAEIPIPREMPYVYDGCTDIFFPIHTSPAFAKNVGLPDIILQGTATLALAARELINREAGGQPERLREIACRFSAMVIPDSEIKVELVNKEKKNNETHLGFRVLNAGGAHALKFGYAKLSS